MDERLLRELYDAQSGVVSRRQLLELGVDDNDLRRLVRRRQLVRVHTGVYLNHTGPVTWINRAWAAVLFHAPAALCHLSALHLAGDVIHVAVEHPRKGAHLPGVRLHRLQDLDHRVRWNTSPPRLRIEEAALDVAGDASSLCGAVAVLTDVCRRRATRPDRLLQALEQRGRSPHGRDLRTVLEDAEAGVHSVLEVRYLRRVERAHGLPRGWRQVRHHGAQGVAYRDVLYRPWGLLVELDGLAWHSDARDRWADMSRDLAAAVDGHRTVRLGWPHVVERCCETAASLSHLLRSLGWPGFARPCGPTCAISGRSQSRGA